MAAVKKMHFCYEVVVVVTREANRKWELSVIIENCVSSSSVRERTEGSLFDEFELFLMKRERERDKLLGSLLPFNFNPKLRPILTSSRQ